MRFNIRLAFILFLAALVLRLLVSPSPGWWGDIGEFKGWMWQLREKGIATAYSGLILAPRQIPPLAPVYQPVFLFILNTVGFVYERLLKFPFGSDSIALVVLIKFPGILCDVGIGLAIYFFLKHLGKGEIGLWAAFLYCFNPYPFFDSAHWGLMADPVYTFFVIVSLMMLSLGKIRLAGVLLALGALTKPQALVYVPLVIFAILRKFGWRGLLSWLLGFELGIFLVCLPFIQKGTLGEVLFSITNAIGLVPTLHTQAFNLWYFVSLGQVVFDTTPILGPMTFQHLGLGLFGLAYLWVLLPVEKDWEWGDLFSRAAFVGFSFFMLCTEMHDNYIFPVIGLLACAAVPLVPFHFFYAAISLSAFLMLALRDPYLRALLTEWLLPGRRAFLLTFELTICLVHILLFFPWWALMRRTFRKETHVVRPYEDPRSWMGLFGILSGALGFVGGGFLLLFRPLVLSWIRGFLIQATPYPREGLNYLVLGMSERSFEFYWRHFQEFIRWAPLGVFLLAILLFGIGKVLTQRAASHPFRPLSLEAELALTRSKYALISFGSMAALLVSLGLMVTYLFVRRLG